MARLYCVLPTPSDGYFSPGNDVDEVNRLSIIGLAGYVSLWTHALLNLSVQQAFEVNTHCA
jgi:hypothetical protein